MLRTMGGMKSPNLYRYATRPGVYFTDDGGADIVVRSETADRMWLSVLEPIDRPSRFYNETVRYVLGNDTDFFADSHQHQIYTRKLPSSPLRETLFLMEGPRYGLWYVHISHAWDGMRYGFRAEGKWDPEHSLRFNPNKLLLDPFAKGIDGAMTLHPAAFSYECELVDGKIVGDPNGAPSKLDSLGYVPLSVAIDDRDITKHDNEPNHPHIPWSKTVIYELHVKGFTANAPWLPEELRGTYAGLAHPNTLSYLQHLGVTSIELLPIMAKQPELFLQERGSTNYWGYSTLNFFSPEPSYATRKAQEEGPTAVRQEVIDMVRALHEAGFEVIMDVVFNHTCEGGNNGPTVCWRGLDNVSYYRQQQHNVGELEDTTGCGNTLDFTNTHNVTFAVDALRYWSKRIGIDGFRFDLAVSLARLNGQFTPYHPFLYALRSDLLLGNLKLIMEPWDVGAQGWRTGQFQSPFGEWNDRFRDTSRMFWITDNSHVVNSPYANVGMQELATRMCGSADLFATDPGRGAMSSINFITAHDGFTLADLTMYAHKHNEANGEHNNDGANVNHSANFGVEGPTEDREVNRRRERAAQNMMGMLLLSLGTPMILAGDEFGNSQGGNNNAYCQDNDITWLDWDWINSGANSPQQQRIESVYRLIAIRKALNIFDHEDFFTKLTQLGVLKPSNRVQWALPDGSAPKDQDWFNSSIRSFSMILRSQHASTAAIVVNGSDEMQQFRLPSERPWHLLWSSACSTGEEPAKGTDIRYMTPISNPIFWSEMFSTSEGDGTNAPAPTPAEHWEPSEALERVFEDAHPHLIKHNVARSATASVPISIRDTIDQQTLAILPSSNSSIQKTAEETSARNIWTVPAQSISILIEE